MNFIQTELSDPDESGRRKVVEIEGSEHTIEADIIVLALGFSNEKLKFFQDNGIELENWGAVKVNEKGETNVSNVFAGGDAVRGADLVVTAALDGREAAMNILEKLLA